MEKGFTGYKEMTEMFQRAYGIAPENVSASKPSHDDNLKEAMAGFQDSFADFAKLWGWIPEKQYRELEKAHADLKKKVDEQEKIIDALRAALDEKGMGHMEFFKRLQHMAQEQNTEFQNLMKSLRGS
jgi:uncharacterized protein YdiU (UPF0061 family)